MERRQTLVHPALAAFGPSPRRPGVKYAWNSSNVPGASHVEPQVSMFRHGGGSKGLIGSLTAQRLLSGSVTTAVQDHRHTSPAGKLVHRRATSAPLQVRHNAHVPVTACQAHVDKEGWLTREASYAGQKWLGRWP